MIFFPNCKINIGLFVTSRREDGYHDLESLFYPLRLCDALEMRQTEEKKGSFTVSGLGVKEGFVSSNENNSVLKAYRLLKRDYDKVKQVNIHLNKAVPCFAGLGGGSSDATFALRLTDYMFDLHAEKDKLRRYSLMLGSDTAFFLENKPAFVYGRGDKMSPSNLSLKGRYIVLIKPKLNISTKEAYSNVNISKECFDLRKLDAGRIGEWKNYLRNDFEPSLFKKYPVLAECKQKMYDMGAVYAQMSGSGATIFGIFDKEQDLKKIKTSKETFVYQEEMI